MKFSALTLLGLGLLCSDASAFTVGKANTGTGRWNANARLAASGTPTPAPDSASSSNNSSELSEKKEIPKPIAVTPLTVDEEKMEVSVPDEEQEEEVVTHDESEPAQAAEATDTEEEDATVPIDDVDAIDTTSTETVEVVTGSTDIELEKDIQIEEKEEEEPEVVDQTPKEVEEYDPKIPTLERLSGATATSVLTNESVELSTFLSSGDDKAMLILGTYAADFNAIEYVQRLRYYSAKLQERGITKIGLVLNCQPDAAKSLVKMLDLKTDATVADGESSIVQLFVDPKGDAGQQFGVVRGWRPDDKEMSPYLKLFGMLWGLGAWATLPAVIGGYIGNPFYGQPWIEDALAVGQRKDRWPNTALELNESGDIMVNKFKELPYVGGWERRPLELATLRLQNMLDISIKNWNDLAPTEEELSAGVLTQLGGCTVIDCKSGSELFRWRDPGICAVANFEDILKDVATN